MPKIVNFFSPRVLDLMKQIEAENDQEKLAQLFAELKLVLNQNNGARKKSPRSAGSPEGDNDDSRTTEVPALQSGAVRPPRSR